MNTRPRRKTAHAGVAVLSQPLPRRDFTPANTVTTMKPELDWSGKAKKKATCLSPTTVGRRGTPTKEMGVDHEWHHHGHHREACRRRHHLGARKPLSQSATTPNIIVIRSASSSRPKALAGPRSDGTTTGATPPGRGAARP